MVNHRLLGDPCVRGLDWSDLQHVTARQIIRNLLLSPPWLILSIVLAEAGWFIPALAASAIFFLAGLRQAHDAFHLTLGLGRRTSDAFLFLLSVAMAMPLHAVKYNHLRHHAHPLMPEDVEGMCARMPGWLAILAGPLFSLRSIWHALDDRRGGVRGWVVAEGLAILALGACVLERGCFGLRYHFLIMLLGNCLTGFFAVWLVHHDCEPGGIFARTERNWLANRLTLHLFYHLEHHLFPAVPACHLPELARRLDAVLPAARDLSVVGSGPSGWGSLLQMKGASTTHGMDGRK